MNLNLTCKKKSWDYSPNKNKNIFTIDSKPETRENIEHSKINNINLLTNEETEEENNHLSINNNYYLNYVKIKKNFLRNFRA